MAIKEISLPHKTIPTHLFGNVNLQNAMMYANENFGAIAEKLNEVANSSNAYPQQFASSEHKHSGVYADYQHAHSASDIIGLNAALDGKADLNHEHPQYLSSLPAHYHSTAEIQGLDERLSGKAESKHEHKISEIENLSTQLGAKAAAADVESKINALGESIRPKVLQISNEEGWAGVAPNTAESGHEAELAATHPKDILAIPPNETPAEKQAREIADIGTSTKAAREDHQHRITTERGSNPTDVGGTEPFPIGDVEQEGKTLWQIGDTGTDGKPKGANVFILYKDEYDGGNNLFGARLELTNDGRISKIVAVRDCGVYIG